MHGKDLGWGRLDADTLFPCSQTARAVLRSEPPHPLPGSRQGFQPPGSRPAVIGAGGIREGSAGSAGPSRDHRSLSCQAMTPTCRTFPACSAFPGTCRDISRTTRRRGAPSSFRCGSSRAHAILLRPYPVSCPNPRADAQRHPPHAGRSARRRRADHCGLRIRNGKYGLSLGIVCEVPPERHR